MVVEFIIFFFRHFIVLQVDTGVLEEHTVSMFRLEGMGSSRK